MVFVGFGVASEVFRAESENALQMHSARLDALFRRRIGFRSDCRPTGLLLPFIEVKGS